MMPRSVPIQDVRRTSLGLVHGVYQSRTETLAWLGLPYARPPVRELRWKAPLPAEPWRGTRLAATFGSACAQVAGFQGPPPDGEPYGPAMARTFGEAVGSEDCLTLNVWRPASDERLPVLVFIHGGANVAGSSADPLYDGAPLAQKTRAVVISMNYRLGAFGWFLHPALRTGTDPLSDSGNLGLLDLLEALRWVKANVDGFGGDSGNVTVMGQSAGAVNELSLMVSPLAKGLFHKVISLSGALAYSTSPRAARDRYAASVVQRLLIGDGSAPDAEAADRWLATNDGPSIRRYLEGRSAAELVKAVAVAAETERGAGYSTGDGVVLPTDIPEALAAGRFLDVPALIGVTSEEGKFFVTDAFRVTEAERFRAMMTFDPDHHEPLGLPELLKASYPTAEAFNAHVAPLSDHVNGLVDRTLALLGPRLQTLYAMRFVWAQEEDPWRTLLGASHAMDLPFVFHNFGRHYFSCAFGKRNEAGREALSSAMTDSIASFLRTGDPNAASLGVRWHPWRPNAPERLVWDAGADAARITVARD
jgi:para-nitrobenzyl esterase